MIIIVFLGIRYLDFWCLKIVNSYYEIWCFFYSKRENGCYYSCWLDHISFWKTQRLLTKSLHYQNEGFPFEGLNRQEKTELWSFDRKNEKEKKLTGWLKKECRSPNWMTAEPNLMGMYHRAKKLGGRGKGRCFLLYFLLLFLSQLSSSSFLFSLV